MAIKSNKNLVSNIPNIVTLARVILIFCAITLLLHDGSILCVWGILVLLLALLLDGADGILARKLSVNNKIGPLIDTLGDRITENAFLVFLVYKNLIPLFIPLVFMSRSFISDFIRCLAFQKGIDTFSLNTSCIGRCLVASKTSRAVYLILKFMVFLLASFVIAYPELEICRVFVPKLVLYAAIIATLINVLRFVALVLDSRKILEEVIRFH